jgi:hypothetical protein
MGSQPLVPRDTLAFFEFCQSHGPVWQTNAASIGVSPSAAAALVAATTAARNAYNAQQAAKEDYRTKTLAADAQETLLRSLVGDAITSIRAYAKNQKDPLSVYNLAQIPPPAVPGPQPAPGSPQNFNVSLETTGAITLKWKMNPTERGSGTLLYTVERRIVTNTGGTGFTQVGAVTKRTFTDSGIPVGSSVVEYRVTATRADRSSEPAYYTVQFGTAGGVRAVVSSFEGPARMAA